MSIYIKLALQIIWGILLLYWIFTAIGAKKTKQREPFVKRFVLYWLPLIVAVILLGPGEWFGHSLLRENFIPHTNLVGMTGLAFCFAGMIIACWTRHVLGKNWSLSVEKKENHELILRGPYQFVRHPIYTGLLLLFLGNVLIVGDWRGIIALAIVFVSFWFKLRKEEKWLVETFGDNYLEYMKRTKALLPGLF